MTTLALPGTVPPQAAARGLRPVSAAWRQGLVSGVLWGVSVAALESLGSPIYDLPIVEAVAFVLALLLMWTSRGVVLALTAQAVEGRLATPAWLALFAAEVVLLGVAWDGRDAVTAASQHWLGVVLPVRTNFFYNAWVLVVYGGPLMWFCMAEQRARRTRDVLARAEIERSRTTAMLQEAEFAALKGHVDPALLLRVVAEIRARYADDRRDAETLLDNAVAFLRSAMPGVRSGRSSIRAELDLLLAYTRLMQGLEPGRIGCAVVAGGAYDDRPFPPLLLLPLVDCLQAAASPVARRPQVALTLDSGWLKLMLDGGAAMPAQAEPLKQRLCRELQALYGDAWRLTCGDSPAMTLWLPLQPIDEETSDER